jgi:tripartite-type tricarboxylate transporter receptor subunit TctC
MRRRILLAMGLVVALGATPLHAQEYPSKPIRIVAPYPPGGTTDLFARSIGDHLQKAWGQPVVIENRPGSSGMIGASSVARSPGDGYTLLIGSQALYSVNPSLYAKVPYDPNKDFTPISLVARLPSYFVVPAALPVDSLKEFIQYVKNNPGKLAYGSAGSGTAEHIFMEMLKSQTGMDLLHVPYKGSAPAVTDLVGERVQAMIEFGPSVLPFIKSGKLKVLGVSTRERSRTLPNVPTIAEAGVPGFDAVTWFAIHGPAGMPPDIVAKLSAEIRKALGEPDVRARLETAGAEPVGTTPEELAATQTRDAVKWSEVIRKTNIRVE